MRGLTCTEMFWTVRRSSGTLSEVVPGSGGAVWGSLRVWLHPDHVGEATYACQLLWQQIDKGGGVGSLKDTTCCGLNCVLKRDVEVLPCTCDCDLIWRQYLCRCSQVKMRKIRLGRSPKPATGFSVGGEGSGSWHMRRGEVALGPQRQSPSDQSRVASWGPGGERGA